MDWKAWLIIGLLVFGVYWYKNPDKGKNILDQGVNTTQSAFHSVQNALSGTPQCSTNYDPICSLGQTYTNLCLGQKAGIKNYTLGVCHSE